MRSALMGWPTSLSMLSAATAKPDLNLDHATAGGFGLPLSFLGIGVKVNVRISSLGQPRPSCSSAEPDDANCIMREDRDPNEDRRDVKRTRILRGAKIILPHKTTVIHCTVQNITSGGACLRMANTYGLPDTFELTFEQGRTRRACRVAWRTDDLIGVAFVAAEENA